MLMSLTNLLQKKLRASSMVEVLVALSICLIIFMIAMSVLMNSQRSNNIRLKQKAQFILSTVEVDSLRKNISFDKGALRLECIIRNNDTIPGVSIIGCSVFYNANHRLGMKELWVRTDQISELNLAGNEMDKN